ncbi:Sialic acid TRAP transporter permease protein SiaT [Paenibacillus plantiphilus]|uniref:Sialic acid TRAP transporter permease protein SiaT n=1 Tax=Paenibacillus plantiphilus TaxID=2905650 RepID=A0ABN8GSY5_9BACL|nr:TRAP transporter small permease [Paenibacillus plantiphilus]CAH1217345.1 Sialic acid TRAP transporter permease protein SiaT [Paenibacillus plantiphilus]
MQLAMKCIDVLNKIVGIIVGIMLAAMSVIIIAQILCRFVFEIPLTWSEEAARYLMVYTVFLGASLALRHHKMIAIEVLPDLLKPSLRRMLKIAIMLISIVFFIILLVQGIDMLEIVQRQVSAAIGITMDIPYFAIPLGALLMIINAIAVIIELVQNENLETSEVAEVLKKGENL